MLTIVGWLWKDPNCATQYTPEHANKWAPMIHRHLEMPHRFVLMTDYPDAEYHPLIQPIKLWDDWRELRNPKWSARKPHCYLRIKAFSKEVRDIFGDRFVSIDLDCVVQDRLDPLFDREEDFVIFHRPNFNPNRERNKYQGSIWMMTTGSRAHVWENFHGAESVEAASCFMGTDQAWFRYALGPEEAGWTKDDGVLGWPDVYSDNRWLAKPPPGARIYFFYGEMKPEDMCNAREPCCKHCPPPLKIFAKFRIDGKRLVRDKLSCENCGRPLELLRPWSITNDKIECDKSARSHLWIEAMYG